MTGRKDRCGGAPQALTESVGVVSGDEDPPATVGRSFRNGVADEPCLPGPTSVRCRSTVGRGTLDGMHLFLSEYLVDDWLKDCSADKTDWECSDGIP